MALNRKTIVEAALRLLNEVGLDGLTTRGLGEALGVKGPALYRHFRTKQELMDELVSELFAEIRAMPVMTDWVLYVATRARMTRQAMLSCRDGARLVSSARPKAPDMEAITRPFRSAGFSDREALYAHMALGSFVNGWTSAEQGLRERDPGSHSAYDSDDAFEFGLETFLAGMRMRLIKLPARDLPLPVPLEPEG